MLNVREKNVLVLGLARSGYAVANLLIDLGANVTVSDLSGEASTQQAAEALIARGARVVLGEHPLSLLDHVDLIVKNPGIRYDVPILLAAVNKKLKIVTEIEVASLYTESPIIAITGSNGKTTTTTLIGEMFAHSQLSAVVSGNIGTAMSAVIKDIAKDTWLVTEVSSFQLVGTELFHPKVSVLLNIYPTHIDYHGSMDNYVDAKLRIFSNQSQGDVAVLNVDQEYIKGIVGSLQLRGIEVYEFSVHTSVKQGLYVSGRKIYYCAANDVPAIEVCAVQDITLRGEFNLENALAAGAAALAAGVPLSSVAHVWRTFKGVEHRLEYVRSINQVTFYNDSKATNPQAAIRAIDSFSEPVIVILGGLERGDDLTPLEKSLQNHCKAAVVLGESAARMREVAARSGVAHIQTVATIEEAVAVAVEMAEAGDVILLSPAAASWDMFSSFEVRGRIFKEAVHKL